MEFDWWCWYGSGSVGAIRNDSSGTSGDIANGNGGIAADRSGGSLVVGVVGGNVNSSRGVIRYLMYVYTWLLVGRRD